MILNELNDELTLTVSYLLFTTKVMKAYKNTEHVCTCVLVYTVYISRLIKGTNLSFFITLL